jgi:hypothetical protein
MRTDQGLEARPGRRATATSCPRTRGRTSRAGAGSWDLDRLIFNADELRAARAALDLADVRERPARAVNPALLERQRSCYEIATLPAATGHEAIGSTCGLAEVEAVLTGLTGLALPRTCSSPRGRPNEDAKVRVHGTGAACPWFDICRRDNPACLTGSLRPVDLDVELDAGRVRVTGRARDSTTSRCA